LVDLAFAGLTPYLWDRLDGQEFSNTNQLLQRALPYGNRAESSRFRDSTNKDKERHHINFVDEKADDEEGNEICVAEWVENPRINPSRALSWSPIEDGGRRWDTLLMCQSVIVSLIYNFGEGLYDSPKYTSYLTPIF
jgi:hypothetical protein